MLLRRALFYGGAILVLAACSDATAPKPQLQTRDGVGAAAAKAPGKAWKTPDAGTLDDCRSWAITQGDKEVCLDDVLPSP